jgi:hypothetical protein
MKTIPIFAALRGFDQADSHDPSGRNADNNETCENQHYT